MKQILPVIALAAVFFTQCTIRPAKHPFLPPQKNEADDWLGPHVIMDYEGKANGGQIPEWVSAYLDGGLRQIESLDDYKDYFTFVSRSEGSHLQALNQWTEGFRPELDFARLASARIEARFLSSAPYPDTEYGSFFEALIRASSDAKWAGAAKADGFWLQIRSISYETMEVNESYIYLILVTMEKTAFASQLSVIFSGLSPNPRPAKDQIAAANRVKERFYDGF